MEFKRNDSIAVIPINEDELMIKEGVFSQRTILIEDQKKSHLLNRICCFIMENSSFNIEDLKKQFTESDDNINEIVDFILNNKLANKRIEQKKKKLAIITNFDTNMISNIFSKSYPTLNCSFFDASIYSEDNNLEGIKDFDFILVLFDRYSPKDFHKFNFWANKYEIINQISFLDNRMGYISPVNQPKFTACYNEVEVHLEATVKNLQEVLIHKEEIINNKNSISPKYSDLLIHCAFIANSINSFDSIGFEKNILTMINYETLQIEKTKVFKMPYCSACNLNEEYTHIFL